MLFYETKCVLICSCSTMTMMQMPSQSSSFFSLLHLPLPHVEIYFTTAFSSVQFSSVVKSCPTLCNPMDQSTPGLLVHHQLLEFIQTHVHRLGDDIQPSHPLSSPSPPAFNLSQHQGLFQCRLFASGGQSTGAAALASVLPMNTQD